MIHFGTVPIAESFANGSSACGMRRSTFEPYWTPAPMCRHRWPTNDEFRLFDQPIPYRGAQGIFNVPDGLIPQNPATFSEESVPAKEMKTQADLIALLMRELRKHPECDHVLRVTITLPVRSAPHHP